MFKKLILLIFPLAIIFSAFAAEKRFVIVEKKDPELCQDIENMLNDPVNKDFRQEPVDGSMKADEGTDFTIPKKYEAMFQRPKWEAFPEDQFTYKFFHRDYIDRIKDYKEKTGEYNVQSTSFDFDGEPKYSGDDTIFRAHTVEGLPWHCFTGMPSSPSGDDISRLNNSQYSSGCSFLMNKNNKVNYLLSINYERNKNINVIVPRTDFKKDEQGYGYTLLVFYKICQIKKVMN